MKKALLISLLVPALLSGSFCGCASNQGQETATVKQTQPAKQKKEKRSKADRLKVGMTGDEVIQAIGKPRGKSVNSHGTQIWSYSDWEKAAFIPFYSESGGKTHYLTVFFDADGKVKSWSSSSQGMY